MKPETEDRDWAASSQWPHWLCTREEDDYDHGLIATTHGFVVAHSEDDYTSLTVIIQGRLHRRTISKGYSRRRLVTLAKRFAAEKAQHAHD